MKKLVLIGFAATLAAGTALAGVPTKKGSPAIAPFNTKKVRGDGDVHWNGKTLSIRSVDNTTYTFPSCNIDGDMIRCGGGAGKYRTARTRIIQVSPGTWQATAYGMD